MPHTSNLGQRPNEQQVVIEALNVAAERKLPLAMHLGWNASAPNGAQEENGTPHTSPWNSLPAQVLEKAQRVDIMQSLAAIEPRMAAVEAEIESLITSPIKLITDISTHTLAAGGKRLRPAMTLICAQLCGDADEIPNERVVSCAAAIELTHTTTLLHDDVVDDADTRRGKPTARLLWGNETSVLVGDYLFTQVFVTAAQKGFGDLVLPLAIATSQMCAGVLLETQTRGYLQISEAQYREIISLKTASLTDCACRLGAMAMNASQDRVDALAQFGHDIGMAFQIVDDVLDVVADQGHLGKPVGHDIREGDVTLPMLRAMQVCTENEKTILHKVVGDAISKDTEVQEDDVQRALAILRNYDCIEYSLKTARQFIDSAKAQLEIFPDAAAKTMLLDIADYVMSREK